MGFRVADEGGNVVVGEECICEDLGRGKALEEGQLGDLRKVLLGTLYSVREAVNALTRYGNLFKVCCQERHGRRAVFIVYLSKVAGSTWDTKCCGRQKLLRNSYSNQGMIRKSNCPSKLCFRFT